MKLRNLNSTLTALWIVIVLVAGVKAAVTDEGQAGTTSRGLLLAGFGSAAALLIVGYLFRKTLFSGKRMTELTAKESAQFAVCVLLGLACIAVFAAVAAVAQQ